MQSVPLVQRVFTAPPLGPAAPQGGDGARVACAACGPLDPRRLPKRAGLQADPSPFWLKAQALHRRLS